MTVDQEQYERELAENHGLLLTSLLKLGFNEMNYRHDLWPPTYENDAYLCVPTQGYTRNDHTKWYLVPVLKAPMLRMYRPWLQQRIKYHEEHHRRPGYGKQR